MMIQRGFTKIGFLLSTLLALGLLSCSQDQQKVVAEPTSVAISHLESNELILGESLQLSATVFPNEESQDYLPASQNVSWNATPSDLVNISSSGLVTAMGRGDVTIKATSTNADVFDEIILNIYLDEDEKEMPKYSEIEQAYGSYLKNFTTIDDSVTGVSVNISTYSKFGDSETNLPVITYIINHKGERAGTMSDIYCMHKLLKEYVVVVVDYQNDPRAISPKLEESAHKINYGISQGQYMGGINFDARKTYLIPSGCLIKRDVVYYELMKSAPKGVMERIVDVWNRSEVKTKVENAGGTYHTASSLSDIVMKNGDPINKQNPDGSYPYLEYKMDIVYPVNPVKEVPLILGASSSDDKNYSRLNSHTERYLSTGFMLNGYAYISYDHEYLPFQFSEYGWGHIEPVYSLQGYLGNRSHTAAVRCAKYYADKLGYSKNLIGVYGHSKSSWCSLLSDKDLTSTNPDELNENTLYPGYSQKETYGPQPYQFYDDGERIDANITCIYHSMGEGTNRARKYVKADLIPTMVGVGEKCQYNSWEKFYQTTGDYCVYKYFVQANPNFIDLPMYGVDHTYPYNRNDVIYDYNYYDAMTSFFSYYLKNGEARLFYTAAGLDHKVLSTDDIFIQFNCQVDGDSVNNNCFVKDANNDTISGNWTSLRQGNRWVFNPINPLVNEERYTIIVGNNVKDLKGNTIKEGREDEFAFKEIIEPTDDDFNRIDGIVKADALASTDSVSSKFGSSPTLRIYRSANGATSRISYIKYNLQDLIDNPNYQTLSTLEGSKIRLEFDVVEGYQTLANPFSLTVKAVTPINQDWDENEMCWSNVKSTGLYPFLSQSSATALENTVTFFDTTSPTLGKMVVDIDFAKIKDFINLNSGDIYGDITLILWSNDNSIRLASKDKTNASFSIPKIGFLYPKQ